MGVVADFESEKIDFRAVRTRLPARQAQAGVGIQTVAGVPTGHLFTIVISKISLYNPSKSQIYRLHFHKTQLTTKDSPQV